MATLLNDPDHISITDGGSTTSAEFRSSGADEFQVTPFFDLLLILQFDTLVDDLDGTGLPFGPADWTGAFQSGTVIPAAGSITIIDELALDVARVIEIPTLGPTGLATLILLLIAAALGLSRRRARLR